MCRRGVPKKPRDVSGGNVRPQEQTDIDRLHSALSFISSDNRDEWVRVGMAIHGYIGDSGFSIWDHWSQQSDLYNERDARSVWRSFKTNKPRIIKIASLFHLAYQNGWTTDRKVTRPVIKTKPAPKPQSSTKQYAMELWMRSTRTGEAVSTHPYAIAKGIDWQAGAGRVRASGRVIGRDADSIIIPIRDIETEKVQAVQCINSQGVKQTFGPISGNAFFCGNTLDKTIRWFVCEGWADAVSLVFHHCQGNAAAFAAMGKGSMDHLARRVADVYAPKRIIVLEDAS